MKFSFSVLISLALSLITQFCIAEPDLGFERDKIEKKIVEQMNTAAGALQSGYGNAYRLIETTPLNLQSGDIKIGDIFFSGKYQYSQPIILIDDIITKGFYGKEVLVKKGTEGYIGGTFAKKGTDRSGYSNFEDLSEVYSLMCFPDKSQNTHWESFCIINGEDSVFKIDSVSNPFFVSSLTAGVNSSLRFAFSVKKTDPENSPIHELEYRLKSKTMSGWKVDTLIDGIFVENIIINVREDGIKSLFSTPFGAFVMEKGNQKDSIRIYGPS